MREDREDGDRERDTKMRDTDSESPLRVYLRRYTALQPPGRFLPLSSGSREHARHAEANVVGSESK